MEECRQQLLRLIDRAFDGVTLGDGVSLHESKVIDGYGSSEERLAARGPDEKTDWHRLIDDPDLTRYFGIGYGGLCFLDAAGVRFHLPACMYRAVRDKLDDDVSSRSGGDGVCDMFESMFLLLTDQDEYNLSRYTLLSNEQRACVRECLVFFRTELQIDDEALDLAIDYWSHPAS